MMTTKQIREKNVRLGNKPDLSVCIIDPGNPPALECFVKPVDAPRALAAWLCLGFANAEISHAKYVFV